MQGPKMCKTKYKYVACIYIFNRNKPHRVSGNLLKGWMSLEEAMFSIFAYKNSTIALLKIDKKMLKLPWVKNWCPELSFTSHVLGPLVYKTIIKEQHFLLFCPIQFSKSHRSINIFLIFVPYVYFSKQVTRLNPLYSIF